MVSLWILYFASFQISVRRRLQPLKTLIQLNKMMFGSKPSRATSLLILVIVMKVFRGHTLTCHRSEYKSKKNECCPMCPVGSRVKTDCSEIRSTSCLPCAEGSFMNKPTGLQQCFPCRNCDGGSGLKTKTSCTTISNTVCELLEGHYCIDITEDSCMMAQRHTSCQPGQYISQKGTAFRDTVCSECSAGTYSDGTFTSCLPHKQCDKMNLQLITPGTASTDAECGEQSSSQTGIVIGGVVAGLLLVVAVAVLLYLRKKKGCLNIGDREKNAVKLKQCDTKEEDVNGDTQETSRALEQNHEGEVKRNPDCPTQGILFIQLSKKCSLSSELDLNTRQTETGLLSVVNEDKRLEQRTDT